MLARILILILMSIWLMACGGGGGEAPSQVPDTEIPDDGGPDDDGPGDDGAGDEGPGDDAPGDQDPVDEEPPVAKMVNGRVVVGAMSHAEVCVSVYAAGWHQLGCDVTDAQGRFGFDIEPQSGPVRVEAIATVSTRMVCPAPAGCGAAAFGEEVDVVPGTSLQVIVPGDLFAGEIAISPLTHMAARWAEKVPGSLNNNVVRLASNRIALLFDLPEDFSGQPIIDVTRSTELADASVAALRHGLLAASFAELATQQGLGVEVIAEQAAQLFAWLGGQMWLQSGQLVLDDIAASIDLSQYPELAEWLSSIDWEAYPELLQLADEYNTISYIGLDAALAAANVVSVHVQAGVDFSSLLAPWEEKLLTTLGGATGYQEAGFSAALSLLDTLEHYQSLAAESDALLDPVTRNLAWLYVDEASRAQTVGLLEVVVEAVQFSLDGSICVPQRKNLQSCDIDPPYAQLKNVGTLLNPSYRVDLLGARYGQQVDVKMPVSDIRDFLQSGKMTMPITGTIANEGSVTTLGINIDLDITNNDLSGFQALCNLCFADSEQLDPLLEALIADLHIMVTVRGGGSVASTDPAIGSYSFANLNTGITFNRRVMTQGESGPVLTARLATGNRTNPAGELLTSLAGETAFELILDDPFSIDLAYGVERAGLPMMHFRLGGELGGMTPILDALTNWIEANLDEETLVEEIDFEALLAELDFDLLAVDGYASIEVLDPDKGHQQYHFTIDAEGLHVSLLAGAEPVVSLRMSGLAGYLFAGDMLVSTLHIGNAGEGVVLSLVDGNQRFYPGPDPGAMLPFDSLLVFLELLYETFAPESESL
jgi:hypothetical protein